MPPKRDNDETRTTPPSDHHYWRDEDVRKLKEFVDRHEKIIKVSDGLAEHVESIVADTKNREWWRTLFNKVKVLFYWIAAGIAATLGAIGLSERWWHK